MVGRGLKAFDVLSCLADLFLTEGTPEYIRSDNGSEFIAGKLRLWLSELKVRSLFIEPSCPWAQKQNRR
jgi:transposase InsO family protein